MKNKSNAVGLISCLLVLCILSAEGQPTIPIVISSKVPSELNPQNGGAPNATPQQAAAFAWQEFIALNWPAGPQEGKPNQRDMPSTTLKFGDPTATGPLVWETFRGKVEIFPGFGYTPPGYPGTNNDPSLGYDALPQYIYNSGAIPACDANQVNDPTPWVNLDEVDEITLASMYAGVVRASSAPGNSSPQLVRFLAKANRVQYVYVAKNSSSNDLGSQWWFHIPRSVRDATTNYLATHQMSPTAGSTNVVSLPYGTIEVKAGWRPLNPSEISSGRFHTQTVRFYEHTADGQVGYRDATWGLVALHIIQKTPTAPFFIYATFEQADNILTADGRPVEDENGNIIASNEPATATTPQVCLVDPRPPVLNPPANMEHPSTNGSVILTDDPMKGQPSKMTNYCGGFGCELYYHNENTNTNYTVPTGGDICVDKRDNAIPDYVIKANVDAHSAIAAYLKQSAINSAPWLYYKLVNVQYFPYDKVISDTGVTPNGSLYTANPPFTAKQPAPSSFYQANIMVETSRSLQLFSGGLTPVICSDWNQDGTPHKNTIYGGRSYNMGGCMGCHGSQGQSQVGDFSVILARGSVPFPEAPQTTNAMQSLKVILRNRTLSY